MKGYSLNNEASKKQFPCSQPAKKVRCGEIDTLQRRIQLTSATDALAKDGSSPFR
jgi:hypothetical protein